MVCCFCQVVLWDIREYADRLQINKTSDQTEERSRADNMVRMELSTHIFISLFYSLLTHTHVHAHTHSLIRSHLSPPPPPLCQDIFITDVKLDHSPIVPPLVLSYLEHSHSLSVSHLHWIPDHNEVRVKPSNYTPLSFYQQCG